MKTEEIVGANPVQESGFNGALVADHAGNLPYGVSGEFGAGAVWRREDGHG